MTRPDDVLGYALEQAGKPYRFGVQDRLDDPNPAAFDCAELVRWACARAGVVPAMVDGSWIQWQHCANHATLTTVAKAVATRGALLFRFSSDPRSMVRPATAHVAFSLGDGFTIEARSTVYGVGSFPSNAVTRGWTHAALIPGVTYYPPPAAPAPTPRPGQAGPTTTETTMGHRIVIEAGHDPQHLIDPFGQRRWITDGQERTAIVAAFAALGLELAGADTPIPMDQALVRALTVVPGTREPA